MNSRKICIIACVSNKNQINEDVDKLIIPDGYELEKRYVVNNINIAKAYNEMMKSTDAKYKIYLQNGVSINNKNILNHIIKIFLENDNMGLVGVAGAETIPTSGEWKESINKVGKYYKVIDGAKNIVEYNQFEEEYKIVKAIDGMFMATQYDVSWRQDLFNEQYFYDIAQCIEFNKRGYKIGVPKQDEIWCIKSNINKFSEEKYKKFNETFIEEYSKDIFPLVSILIPAYNRPEFFEIALQSAIDQTYKNIEIIVGDDSTNDGVKNVIQSYLKKYENIRYYNNGGPLGNHGINNGLKCLELANGELINYLMDDDIFHKDKIKKMVNYFVEEKGISIVTCYRKIIDEFGTQLEDIEPTEKIVDETTIFIGNKLIEIILFKMINFIGEPTVILFRKKDILENGFGTFCNKSYTTIIDVATWVNLLQKGDLVYIAEPLSFFRMHSGQNENKPELMVRGVIEWLTLINDYDKNNKLANKKEYIVNWIYLFVSIIESIRKKEEFKTLDLRELYSCYNWAIKYIFNL